MNNHGNPRRFVASIHPGPDFLSENSALNFDCRHWRLVARRIFHARRLFFQLRQRILPIITDLREGAVTRGGSFAFSQQQLHCAGSTFGVVQWHFQISRRDAEQDCAAHVFGMSPHVNQLRTRSVRCPKQIDLVVTEPRPYIVQIIHRAGGCVFCQVRALLKRLTHLGDVIDRIHLAHIILRRFLTRN